MTPAVTALWEGAKKNEVFKAELLAADPSDKFPSKFRAMVIPDLERTAWATLYYGWLVGTYGTLWKKHR